MSLEDLIATLGHSEDEIKRSDAAEELAAYEGEKVILALVEAIGDEDQLVSVAAMESLKRCRPDPTPYLQQALKSANLSIRSRAAGLLKFFPSRETEVALRMMLADESSHVRGAACRSLRSMINEHATILALKIRLDDPESFPRYEALRTLRAFDPQLVDAGRIIQRDLQSDDALTRVAAIHFIREDGEREWLGEVEVMRTDSDFRVRRAAEWALERLREEAQ